MARSTSGQASTEALLIIAVVTIAVVAGAYTFVDTYRHGIKTLALRVFAPRLQSPSQPQQQTLSYQPVPSQLPRFEAQEARSDPAHQQDQGATLGLGRGSR